MKVTKAGVVFSAALLVFTYLLAIGILSLAGHIFNFEYQVMGFVDYVTGFAAVFIVAYLTEEETKEKDE